MIKAYTRFEIAVTEEHSASILTVEDLEDGNSTKMF
jgi:hypothetical protein